MVPPIVLEMRSAAPPLRLLDPVGRTFDMERDALGHPVLIMFMCNHCPYVKHVAPKIGELAASWVSDGLIAVAINSNAATHPVDAPERMASFAAVAGWDFPYLVDEDQTAARALGAVSTPDVFLFDSKHRLQYRGQIDDTRPSGTKPATGEDLDAAVRAVLAGSEVERDQAPSVGCSIKWIADNERA